jgi:hypothetical protein
MRSRVWTAIVATVCLIATAPIVLAQHAAVSKSTSTGSVSGVLKDPAGAVIPGARVELHSTASEFRQTRISDPLGHYSFVSVPIGNYQLTVTAAGFASQMLRSLAVAAGLELSANLSLRIATAAESVKVEGQDISSLSAFALDPRTATAQQSRKSAEPWQRTPA